MFDTTLIGILILLRTVAAPALVQQIGPGLPDTPFNHETFRFAPPARAVLHELWEESHAANEERVACIRGYRFDGVYYVTRAERAPFLSADALHLKPDPATCGAPEWHGPAHTHVARFDGRPFVTFSHADRTLMTWWRKTWKSEGVFCVLYSESQAYCEYAASLNGDGIYAGRDPIEEMYYAATPVQRTPPSRFRWPAAAPTAMAPLPRIR